MKTHHSMTFYILCMMLFTSIQCTLTKPFRNDKNITQLRVGFITPRTGNFGFETIASAATMAITAAHEDGYLPGITVK